MRSVSISGSLTGTRLGELGKASSPAAGAGSISIFMLAMTHSGLNVTRGKGKKSTCWLLHVQNNAYPTWRRMRHVQRKAPSSTAPHILVQAPFDKMTRKPSLIPLESSRTWSWQCKLDERSRNARRKRDKESGVSGL